MGLSPPTRGSHEHLDSAHRLHGSIPAHAGKPTGTAGHPLKSWVYPRPRGEAEHPVVLKRRLDGLSPPTRGSLYPDGDDVAPRRSIPAHAGKPRRADASKAALEVYPRPRGEAWTIGPDGAFMLGLSPPTRGSRECDGAGVGQRGSIPAHAGKPIRYRSFTSIGGVYPRPRGEAPEC